MRGTPPPGGSDIQVDRYDIFDLLAALSERSLVVTEQRGSTVRHRLLETVRQYGRDLLHEQGESAEIRNLHRDYFLAFAEELGPKLKGAEQMKALSDLHEEHENLRASLEWCLQEDGSEEALRMCIALSLFWWRGGHMAEGREWCVRALTTKVGKQRTALRARVLNGAGLLCCLQGDNATALGYFEESREILLETENQEWLGESLNGLAFATFFLDDYEASRAHIAKANSIAREVNDRWLIATTVYFMGILTRIEGDYETALKYYKESIALYRHLGDRIGLSYPVYDIGLAEYYRGNLPVARGHLQESLAIREDTNDLWGLAESQFGLGLVDFGEMAFVDARSRFSQSLKLGKEIGDKTRIAVSLHWLGMIALAEGDSTTAKLLNDESMAIYSELGDRWGMALCFAGYAALSTNHGDHERALKLWAFADKLREEIGSPLPPVERARRDKEVSMAKAALSDDQKFKDAWSVGEGMSLEHAIECATTTL